MKLPEMNVASLGKVTDEEVVSLHHRLHQLFGNFTKVAKEEEFLKKKSDLLDIITKFYKDRLKI